MDAPYYNGGPGDDDPEGDGFSLQQEADGCCLSCGARDDEPCQWDCECRTCLKRQGRDEDVA